MKNINYKPSLIERLKICLNVLTKKNYIFFGIGKDPIIWNEDGEYKCLNDTQLKVYEYVDDNYKFNTNIGTTTLHDFVWECVEDFAKTQQKS